MTTSPDSPKTFAIPGCCAHQITEFHVRNVSKAGVEDDDPEIGRTRCSQPRESIQIRAPLPAQPVPANCVSDGQRWIKNGRCVTCGGPPASSRWSSAYWSVRRMERSHAEQVKQLNNGDGNDRKTVSINRHAPSTGAGFGVAPMLAFVRVSPVNKPRSGLVDQYAVILKMSLSRASLPCPTG